MNSSIDCQYVRESFAGTTARQKQEQLKKNKISVGDTASTFGVVTRGSTVQTGRLAVMNERKAIEDVRTITHPSGRPRKLDDSMSQPLLRSPVPGRPPGSRRLV